MYTKLHKVDIKVPRLCVGTWQAKNWEKSDPTVFKSLLEAAFDLGLNFFDTAEAYGDGYSEELIGETFGNKRENVIIASKVLPFNCKPQKLRNSLEKSLTRLQTDYIDIYYQHWPAKKPPLDDTLLELLKLKEEGKIRAIGVSNWMEPEFKEASRLDLVDCLQPCYNLLWRSVEKEVLRICEANQIAVIPYSPLGQGILAGKTTLPKDPDDPRHRNVLYQEEKRKEVLDLLKVVKELAEKYKKTMAQISLRWLLEQPVVTSVIVGQTSLSQLKENIEVFDFSLAPEDVDLLDTSSRAISADLAPYDTLWKFHPRR